MDPVVMTRAITWRHQFASQNVNRQLGASHPFQDDHALVHQQLQRHLELPQPRKSPARASFRVLQLGDMHFQGRDALPPFGD
jgi:hypothetical protein